MVGFRIRLAQRLIRYFVFLAVWGLAGFAQTSPKDVQAVRETAVGVAQMSRQLRFTDAATAQHYHMVRDDLTGRIYRQIDNYIANTVKTKASDSKGIVEDLRRVLGNHEYSPEYSGPPFAALGKAGNGHSLVVAYMLVRGGTAVNDSAVTIRGYRETGGQFKMVASTGGDFDGYGLFVREFAAPVPSQQWILAWGPLFGFNGNKVRIRMYAFDGEGFKTLWAPPDALNARILFGLNGFSVEHLDEERYYQKAEPPYTLHDDYSLTPDGPQKIASYHVPE